jgi:Mannosyltransferase (PIG-V)
MGHPQEAVGTDDPLARPAEAEIDSRGAVYAWAAAVAALLSRVVVFVAGYYWTVSHGTLAVDLKIRDVRYAEALHGLAGRLFDPWAHWDGVWFVRIASTGYAHPNSPAFFPLYPLLVRGVSYVTGGNYVIAGIIVSLAAYAAAMLLLFKLVRPLFGASVAAWTVVFISWFPTSVVFSAVYSESLFLLLTVASFWFAARRSWWAAGLAGLLATLTRSSGVLLVLPLLLLYGREVGWSWRGVSLRWPREARLGWLLLVPLGLALYSGYLRLRLGSATLFMTAQQNWKRHLSDPLSTLVLGYHDARLAVARLSDVERSLSRWLTPGHPGQNIVVFHIAPFAALAVATVALTLAVRRFPAGYTAWALVGLLLPLCYPAAADPLYSLHRFVLVLFPVFIALALVTRRVWPLRWVLLALSAGGLVWYTFVFAAFAHLG